VKILVDILAEHYDQIVAQLQRESRLYAILMCGEIVYDQRAAKPKKMIRVLCDSADASFILESTKTLCPEATWWVKKSITRHRPR
jgi:hypothetical protein